MHQPKPFIVGRQAEVEQFNDLLAGRTNYWLLNIYGPGGIGKTVVCHKLATHAQSRGVPVASVDGIRPDLTPDRILYAFKEGLTEGPTGERLEDTFRDFERRFRDYLTVNEVLQQGGGVQALFDVVGNVKDPAGLAAILSGLGEAVTEAAKRTVSNRFALERYLRGAERALTASFVDGLGAALERAQGPLTLLVDTYEELEGLDDWVCRTLMPALPSGVRLVILGRNQLHRINFDWSDHGDAVHTMPLPELSEEEAKAYLRHYGLTDPMALDQVYQFTGGYPLLLVLVRHLAREAGGWENIGALERSADRDFVATQLLERILREERVAEVRAFLEKGVIARWFDPETISVILEVELDEGRAIYDKLRRHSFIERHPYGLRFHDKIRELLLERLKFTSQPEYERLTERLMAYYAEKAGIPHPPAVEEQTEAELPRGAKYTIHIERAQGIVIGDQARVTQQFGGKTLQPTLTEAAPVSRDQRCSDLAESIRETLELVKQYEDQRRLADDPKAKRRAEREITDLRSQLAAYEAEYRELGCQQNGKDG
jgi:RecA/RadA recombinase